MTVHDGLSIKGVEAVRGNRTVLHKVSLEVPPGEITALLGPNGAGKSTLVLAIGGALRLTAGSMSHGAAILEVGRPDLIRQSGIAVVPEGRRLLRSMTVAENLEIGTYMLERTEAKAGIAYALELFPELEKRWNLPTRLLSGGEQQMVVLAQALASKPSIIVIDELSLGLAPVVVRRLMSTLAIVSEAGVGILLIEQFAHLALALSKSAYLLNGGRVEYAGTAAHLRKSPELMSSTYLRATAGGEAKDTAPSETARSLTETTETSCPTTTTGSSGS